MPSNQIRWAQRPLVVKNIGNRIAVTAMAALATASLTACGGSEEPNAPVAGVADAVNAATDTEVELQETLNRLVIDCMEGKGFDVHPLYLTDLDMQGGTDREYKQLIGSEPPYKSDLPSLEKAGKEGFGNSKYFDPDIDIKAEKEKASEELGEDDPFYAESESYQEEYEKAQNGEEYYEFSRQSFEADDPKTSEDAPMVGGCTAEVNKAVYVKPTKLDEDEGGGEFYGIAKPDAITDFQAQLDLFQTDKLLDSRDKLYKCVEAEGYPYFEYTEGLGLGFARYVDGFYADTANGPGAQSTGSGDGGQGEVTEKSDVELPPGAPWEFDKAYEEEKAFAVVVATCADDTGFRKTAKSEWDGAMVQLASDNEDEIFAWHDDLKSALEKAQQLLGK
jgi:hypothetical protein